jgi:hypothetical protein
MRHYPQGLPRIRMKSTDKIASAYRYLHILRQKRWISENCESEGPVVLGSFLSTFIPKTSVFGTPHPSRKRPFYETSRTLNSRDNQDTSGVSANLFHGFERFNLQNRPQPPACVAPTSLGVECGHPIVNGPQTSSVTRVHAFLAQVRGLEGAAPTGAERRLGVTAPLCVTVQTCYNSSQHPWALGSDHVDIPRHPRRDGKRTTEVV